MNPLIVGIAVIILGILIYNSSIKKNPEAELCAQEILALLKQNPAAKAKEIAAIMIQHRRTQGDAGQVTMLVKTRLTGIGVHKNEREDVMLEVRKAKMLLNKS